MSTEQEVNLLKENLKAKQTEVNILQCELTKLRLSVDQLKIENSTAISLRERALIQGLAVTTQNNAELALKVQHAEHLALHTQKILELTKDNSLLHEKNLELESQLKLVQDENAAMRIELLAIKQENCDLQSKLVDMRTQLDSLLFDRNRQKDLFHAHDFFTIYKFYYTKDWSKIAEEISIIEEEIEDEKITMTDGVNSVAAVAVKYGLDKQTPLSQLKKLCNDRTQMAHPNSVKSKSAKDQKNLISKFDLSSFSTLDEDEKFALNFIHSKLKNQTNLKRLKW